MTRINLIKAKHTLDHPMREKMSEYQQKMKIHGRNRRQEPRNLFQGDQVLVRNLVRNLVRSGF